MPDVVLQCNADEPLSSGLVSPKAIFRHRNNCDYEQQKDQLEMLHQI